MALNGQWGEAIAVIWLRLHGWRIIERHWAGARHSGAGEIDIIARRGHILIFVEVKTRRTLEQARWAMTAQQWRRQQRSVGLFLSSRPDLAAQSSWRLDLILLSPWRYPRHIKDAWSC